MYIYFFFFAIQRLKRFDSVYSLNRRQRASFFFNAVLGSSDEKRFFLITYFNSDFRQD